MQDKKEYFRKYLLKRYHSTRHKTIKILGNKCVSCGSRKNLEIDHVNPSEKRVEAHSFHSISKERYFEELKKCQLLCHQCHKEKTSKENSGFKHGTIYSWMRKKCTCESCKQSKKIWNDNRNKERRALATKSRGSYSKNPEHGTAAKYKRGCKCSLCKKANAEKERLRRKRVSKIK